MRTVLALAALLSTSVASAEVRFINATGQALTVDVLHADGQVRDIALSADRGITKPHGPDIGSDDGHMVVVRDASGKEVLREKMRSNRIHVIKFWGTSTTVSTGEVGVYKGKEFDMAKIGMINATGQELTYKAERPDFSISEQDSDPNGPKDVHYRDIVNLAKEPGVTKKVDITGEKGGSSSHELITGGLYHVTQGKTGFVVELVADASKADPTPAK